MTTTPLTSWVPGADDGLFGIDNLPYGVFTRAGSTPRVGVRIGDQVLDLAGLAHSGLLRTESVQDPIAVFDAASLNPLLGTGAEVWQEVRMAVTALLSTGAAEQGTVSEHLIDLAGVQMLLPIEVGDYVDFYASEHHASNVGRMFRPDSEPLTPNWKHLPIGYHGRSGTVVVSGRDVIRPNGQRKAPSDPAPTFGRCEKLDIEAELGFVVGSGSTLGAPVAAANFADHVFGVVGLNDWSARDLQAWEYVPLGPFLGKSFATTISAWVTPLAALRDAACPLPAQDPEPLAYLAPGQTTGLAIEVEVEVNGQVVARPPYAAMYWSPAQMLAHMTVNGASVRPGDLYASGTISGPDEGQFGSFLELSWNGTKPFAVADSTRTFLEDDDEVVLRYTAPGPAGRRIGLGEVRGTVRAAR